jgi:hypothetical protein
LLSIIFHAWYIETSLVISLSLVIYITTASKLV